MTWLAIFFAIPFVTLFLTSLQAPVAGKSGQYVPAFQVSNYPDALIEYWPQFLKSFIYAGIATALALLIAYPLAYFIAFKAGRWRALMLVLVIAPPHSHLSYFEPMHGKPFWLMKVSSPLFSMRYTYYPMIEF